MKYVYAYRMRQNAAEQQSTKIKKNSAEKRRNRNEQKMREETKRRRKFFSFLCIAFRMNEINTYWNVCGYKNCTYTTEIRTEIGKE